MSSSLQMMTLLIKTTLRSDISKDKSKNALIFITIGVVVLLVCIIAILVYVFKKRANSCIQNTEQDQLSSREWIQEDHNHPLVISNERDSAGETASAPVVTDPDDLVCDDGNRPPSYNDVLEEDKLRSNVDIHRNK